MAMPLNQTAAPNWYADPADPTVERYWDGLSWTQHTRPVGGAVATVNTSNTWSTITMILAPFALLFSPLIFGIVGLVTGMVARRNFEPKADRALKILGIAALVGMILSIALRGALGL